MNRLVNFVTGACLSLIIVRIKLASETELSGRAGPFETLRETSLPGYARKGVTKLLNGEIPGHESNTRLGHGTA